MDIWLQQVGDEVFLFGRYYRDEEPKVQAMFKDWAMAKRVFPEARIK